MKVAQKNIAGKRISILGMARSGIASAVLLKEMGASVFVSDSAPSEKLNSQIAELGSRQIEYEAGSHSDRILDSDIIVASPGVPTDAPIMVKAAARNIRIVSELEAASWFCRGDIIAVTGTNGKTTTTALLGSLIKDGGRHCLVGGNIGNAFSGFVNDVDSRTIAVLEVSSFQLDFIDTFHPKISIILNITPDHLDRYDHNFEKYIASKCRVFSNQTKNDFLIYNHDDLQTRQQVRRLASQHVRTVPFGLRKEFDEGAFLNDGKLCTVLEGNSREIISADDIYIRGTHNLYNSMAAVLASEIVGIDASSAAMTLRSFPGVEHRLEFVRELGGVKYINDSKATNVDSVWYALQAYSEPLIVLMGGRDKGNDYSKLHDLVRKNVKAIIAIGETADKVYREFHSIKKVLKASDMKSAVLEAKNLAVSGDIVLLSPACASFDWFENYEHRGKVFKQIVKEL